MAQSRGKKFEQLLKEDFLKIDNAFCFRLNDQMSGYYGASRNPSDFICYVKPNLFLLEAKTIKGNTFSTDFRQYDELIKYKNIDGVIPGVVIWFYDHDKVVWIPVETFTKLREDGKKSFNIKMLGDDTYFSLEIPSKKMRTFMHSDYSALVNYYEGCK